MPGPRFNYKSIKKTVEEPNTPITPPSVIAPTTATPVATPAPTVPNTPTAQYTPITQPEGPTGIISPTNPAHPDYEQSKLAGGANNDFWRKAGNQFGVGTEGVMNDMISGNAMNAAAIRQREATARSEANSRALTAAQIQQAGFAGTPLGASAANASEAALLQNRFDNNLDLEVQRQNMRQQGANMAVDYANNVNRFSFESADAKDKSYNNAMANLSDSIMAKQDTMNAVAKAAADPMATPEMKSAAIGAVRDDAILNDALQKAWEASGKDGQYPDDFAFQQIDAIHRTTNAQRVLENSFMDRGYSREEAELFTKMFRDNTFAESLGYKVVYGDDGELQLVPLNDPSVTDPLFYKSGESDVWGYSPQKILTDTNLQKEQPEKYKEIVNDAAKDLMGGESKKTLAVLDSYPLQTKKDILKAMYENGDVTRMSTVKGWDDSGSPYYKDMDAAYQSGGVVRIGDRYAIVTGKTPATSPANKSQWVTKFDYSQGVVPKNTAYTTYTIQYLDTDTYYGHAAGTAELSVW